VGNHRGGDAVSQPVYTWVSLLIRVGAMRWVKPKPQELAVGGPFHDSPAAMDSGAVDLFRTPKLGLPAPTNWGRG
jgi:hypothetical protein